MSEKLDDAAKFRLIAALATDIAAKLEKNQTWPGDVHDAAARIEKALSEVVTP